MKRMRSFPCRQRGFWFLIPLAISAVSGVAQARAARKQAKAMERIAAQAPTEPEPVAAMPEPPSAAAPADIHEQRKKAARAAKQRRGRRSTILTQQSGDISEGALG